MKRFILITSLFAVLALSFQNCGQDQFLTDEFVSKIAEDPNVLETNFSDGDISSGSELDSVPAEEWVEDSIGIVSSVHHQSATVLAEQIFEAKTSKKPIDVVWVIDNSASMEDSVNNVKANFKAFVESLEADADINLALISRQEVMSNVKYRTQINLTDYSSKGLQIPFMVHSYNPMLVAAAATCPEAPDAGDTFCIGIKSKKRYSKVYGALNSFFRQDSYKVFVFVTDDDSRGLTSQSHIQYDSATNPKNIDVIVKDGLVQNEDFILPSTFQTRMSQAFGGVNAYKTFGFIAFDKKTSPCLYRESKNYASLISQTQGMAYNVCDTNWKSSFAKLTEDILLYAETNFRVTDTSFVAVDSVSLNGAVLRANMDYTVSGNAVTLDPQLLANVGNYQVRVSYSKLRE
ncbi:MAG: hypothetical protein ACLGGX_08335 [Bdellovibrionia bacterium]